MYGARWLFSVMACGSCSGSPASQLPHEVLSSEATLLSADCGTFSLHRAGTSPAFPRTSDLSFLLLTPYFLQSSSNQCAFNTSPVMHSQNYWSFSDGSSPQLLLDSFYSTQNSGGVLPISSGTGHMCCKHTRGVLQKRQGSREWLGGGQNKSAGE